jgi:acylphosphatase
VSDRLIRHVVARGRVQGVGYRAFVEDEAYQHGLQGWVRNRRDGSVEAVFAGPAAEVEAAIEACRRGPFSARVSALDQREGTEADLAARAGGETFSVLQTI